MHRSLANRRLGRAALALTMITVSAPTALPGQAHAASWRNTGYPGRVRLPTAYGFTANAASIPSCVFCPGAIDYIAAQHVGHQFAVYFPARGVWRAPYRGTQVVTV